MVIKETSVFTRQIRDLLTDDDYRKLQLELVQRPSVGPVIPRSGGLRKLRWALKGQGKRGGARVIYYWAVAQDQLIMLFIYTKSNQEHLTPEQLATLKSVIESEYP